MRDTNKNRFSKSVKSISSFTAFLFLTTTILQAAPSTPFFDQKPSTNNNISNISELMSGIPTSVGEVESSWQPKDFLIGKQPLVVLFQEVHSNPETQIHIASALDQIHAKLNKLGITQDFAIGVEGVPFEETDLSLFNTFPIKKAVQDVSRSFLSEGKIDGAKYAAINLKNPDARLFGLENADLYKKNLLAYRNFLKYQDSAKEVSQSLLKITRELREKVYTQSLLELAQGREKLEKTPGYLPIFLRTLEKLGKKKGLTLSQYPHISEFKAAIEESERKNNLRSNPLSLYSTKKIMSFFDELQRMTENLEQTLSRSVDEKLLVKISKYALLLNKISSLSLTRDEYYQFKKLYHSMKEKGDWRAFNDLLSRRKETQINIQKIENLLQDLKPAVTFYELALIRDGAMSQSIERLTKISGSKVVAAVTGGFHRDGISRYLISKNIPFIVISAKSSGKWDGEAYWRLLSENQKSLDDQVIETQTLRPTDRPIAVETVLSLVGSIPFYIEEAAKQSAGKSLGASMTHDQIYEAVVLQYLKDIEAKKPDPSQKDQLRAIKILKKIISEIKARREKGESIQLNSFHFNTDTAQLAIFVQRLNSNTNAWEPAVPDTLDGFSPVKMAEKTDLNGQIAPGYQHFRLKVFGKQKPGLSSSASAPAAKQPTPAPVQPAVRTNIERPVVTVSNAAEEISDSGEEPSTPPAASARKKIGKVFAILVAGFFAIAAISDGLKYYSKRKEENRIRQNITSSEQMIRRILDEIWKKNYREAESLLDSAEHDTSLSLPLPSDAFLRQNSRTELPPNLQFVAIRELIRTLKLLEAESQKTRDIRLPNVRILSNKDFGNYAGMMLGTISKDKAQMFTLMVIPANDLLLIRLFEIKAFLIMYQCEIPSDALNNRLITHLEKAEDIISRAQIPDTLKREFSVTLFKFLELHSASSNVPAAVQARLTQARTALTAHTSYAALTDTESENVRSSMNALTLRNRNYFIWKQLLEYMMTQYQNTNAYFGEDPISASFRRTPLYQELQSLGRAAGLTHTGDRNGNLLPVHEYASLPLFNILRALKNHQSSQPNFTWGSPYLFTDGVAFYIQKLENGNWMPDLTDRNAVRFPGNYADFTFEGSQYRLVYVAAQGRSLGEKKYRQAPLVLELDDSLLKQAMSQDTDFRDDHTKQPIVFTVADSSSIRKISSKYGKLLSDRHVYLVEWNASLKNTTRQDLSNLLDRIKIKIGNTLFLDGNIEDIKPEQLLYVSPAFSEDWGDSTLRVVFDQNQFSDSDYRSALLRTALSSFGNMQEWNSNFTRSNNNTYSIIEAVLAEQMRAWHAIQAIAQAA